MGMKTGGAHAAFEVPYQLTDAEIAPEPTALGDIVEKAAAIFDEFKKTNEFTPIHDWRATQLARELCRAQGHDPDMMVVDVNHAHRGPFGSVSASSVVPAWTLYLAMAGEMSGALCSGSSTPSSPSSPSS